MPNTVEEGAVGEEDGSPGVVVPDGGGATNDLNPPVVVTVLLDVWEVVPTGGPPVDTMPGPLDTGEPWLSASSWEVVSLDELVVVTFDFSALPYAVRYEVLEFGLDDSGPVPPVGFFTLMTAHGPRPPHTKPIRIVRSRPPTY
jgi:hypothetical protein